MNSKRLSIFSALFLFTAACGIFSAPSVENVTPAAQESPAPLPTISGVQEPRSLTICLGQEPNTLYPFGELNPSARSALAAVYDDPYDLVSYEYKPNLLSDIPSLENGDAQVTTAQVSAGAEIVDAEGNVVKLTAGTTFRPAGCRADDCVVVYDGSSALEMDQMVVTFRMRDDVSWSDGTPLTADDSVFAFTLIPNNDASTLSYLKKRTQTYESADAHTVQWWGLPGYVDSSYAENFFPPAPKHLWSKFPVEQLPEIDVASRSPVGWGPYVIREWSSGDHLKLIKNEYYFRKGYPKFDTLIFRFLADPNAAMSELVAGRCDLIDPSIPLDNHVKLLMELQRGEQVKYFAAPGMTIEWLGLGVTPASYDDGYNINFQTDRADIFGDAHTRQGIAYCLDRQKVVDNVLFGLTSVPASYLPAEHPLYDSNLEALRFDPSVGLSMLETAGWRDTDGDPSTPLVAVTVKNVQPGTPLQLNYYATTSTQRRQAAEILKASLAQCEIGVDVQYFSQNELYAPGPQGALFGRKFDLAQYAMGVDGIVPACEWFMSREIPSPQNSWIGTNLSGYKNPEYDAACRRAQLSLPDEESYAEAYRQTQVLFADDLPAIPLFYRLRIAASRYDLCGFSLDPTANPLWNIEYYDMGEACQP